MTPFKYSVGEIRENLKRNHPAPDGSPRKYKKWLVEQAPKPETNWPNHLGNYVPKKDRTPKIRYMIKNVSGEFFKLIRGYPVWTSNREYGRQYKSDADAVKSLEKIKKYNQEAEIVIETK